MKKVISIKGHPLKSCPNELRKKKNPSTLWQVKCKPIIIADKNNFEE